MKKYESIIEQATEPQFTNVMWLDTTSGELKAFINGFWKKVSSGSIEYATNEEIDALFDEGGDGGSSSSAGGSSSSGGGEYPEDAYVVLSGYPDSQGGEITYKDVEYYDFADFLDKLRMGSNYPPIYGYTDDYVKYTIDVFDYDEDAGELVIVLNNGDHVSMHESLNTWTID